MNVLLVIGIAMAAGLLMSRAIRLLRLPNVTAFLLAGLVIGPCVSNLITKEQADHYFVKAVSKDRFRRKIALITQDKQLTEDINLLNRIHSAKANQVHTYKLEKGMLVRTPLTQQKRCNLFKNSAQTCS